MLHVNPSMNDINTVGCEALNGRVRCTTSIENQNQIYNFPCEGKIKNAQQFIMLFSYYLLHNIMAVDAPFLRPLQWTSRTVDGGEIISWAHNSWALWYHNNKIHKHTKPKIGLHTLLDGLFNEILMDEFCFWGITVTAVKSSGHFSRLMNFLYKTFAFRHYLILM